MLGIPSLGERVKLWPTPGLKVQLGGRPLDSGGRFMASKGELVAFDEHHLEQLRAGAVMLHPPPCAKHAFDAGADECKLCGRSGKEAQQYDVDFAAGSQAAKDAAKKPAPQAKGKE